MPVPPARDPSPDRTQEFMQQLEIEFRDSATDLLRQADVSIEAARLAGSMSSEDRDAVYRIAHSLKGLIASFGHSLASVVAHRFEDYLADLDEPGAMHLSAMQKFVDALGDLVDGTVVERSVNAADFIRRLPSRPTGDLGDIEARDVEVLMVMPNDAVSRHVARELQACGYRVTRESNSFKAIEIAALTRPDLVIASGILDALSGIDVVSAFRAMPATQYIPVALMTSATREEVAEDGLPDGVPVIRKGQAFGDDLTDALTQVGIL